MKLIINADDLGYSLSVNEAISNCLDAGVITSSTIMAAGTAIDGVKEIVLRHPEVSFGIHLCLDEVRPLSSIEVFAKYGILDSDGILTRGWYKDVKPTKELVGAIYEEWKAQIDYILSLGIPVSHLDSHHHVHNMSYLNSVLTRLSTEFKIEKVRLPLFLPPLLRRQMKLTRNPLDLQSKAKQSKIKKLTKYLFGLADKNKELKWMKKTFVTTDFFCHADTFFNNTKVLERYETIEIMCHPGHPAYEEETNMLFKFDFGKIQKISYKEL